MNKTDLQNLLFNVRHGNVTVEEAMAVIGDNTEAIYDNPKPIKMEVWEQYPDYKSCVKGIEKGYIVDINGGFESIDVEPGEFAYFSKKLAKRQLAELQLFAIAEKWGEGINDERFYMALTKGGGKIMVDSLPKSSFYFNSLSFYFRTKQQLEKSLELHKQLWKDYFMID